MWKPKKNNRRLIKDLNKKHYGYGGYPYGRNRRINRFLLVGFVLSVVIIVLFVPLSDESPLIGVLAPGLTGDMPVDDAADNQGFLSDIKEDIKEEVNVYIQYAGSLELPVNGAAGYAPAALQMMSAPVDGYGEERAVTLAPGTAFLILREQNEWWEIQCGGETGWVKHEECFINLPDVIPSVVYDNTNTYHSQFTTQGHPITHITGEALYEGKSYNQRLEKNEYAVAVLYAMAKKIYKAQQNALANGDTLIIHEGFRPYPVQRKVANALFSLSGANNEVYQGLNAAPWNISHFMSAGVTHHQTGCAIDVSLAHILEMDYAHTGMYRYIRINAFSPYTMPTRVHDISIESALFFRPADITAMPVNEMPLADLMRESEALSKLLRYCTAAGLSPTASKWWQFNDLDAGNTVSGQSAGDYELPDPSSVPPA